MHVSLFTVLTEKHSKSLGIVAPNTSPIVVPEVKWFMINWILSNYDFFFFLLLALFCPILDICLSLSFPFVPRMLVFFMWSLNISLDCHPIASCWRSPIFRLSSRDAQAFYKCRNVVRFTDASGKCNFQYPLISSLRRHRSLPFYLFRR